MSVWWALTLGAFAGFVAGLTVALLAAAFFLWRGTRAAERSEARAHVLAHQQVQRDKTEADKAFLAAEALPPVEG